MAKQRLDKILAAQGLSSRKEVKALISKGLVAINGQVVRQADFKVDPDVDQAVVNGKELPLKEYLYLMLHKPPGIVSATRDRNLPTVVDLVPPSLQRRGLFPAGRLDKDTEGFVLITDDGAFAHRILTPRNHLPKVYLARLDQPIGPQVAVEFAKGVKLDEEDQCSPAQLEILENGANPQVQVTIHEGMYHQIKRMFERFGYKVIYLKRLQIGGLPLDPTLPMGECRELTPAELASITAGYLD